MNTCVIAVLIKNTSLIVYNQKLYHYPIELDNSFQNKKMVAG